MNPALLPALALLAVSVTAIVSMRILTARRIDYILEVVRDVRRGNGNRRLRVRPGGGKLERIADEFNALIGEFQETLRDKRSMEASQRLMVSQISHDLRTPLTSIMGYVDALSEDGTLSGEERTAFLRIVKDKCVFLDELIDEFFALSLLDLEAPGGAAERVDLCAAAENALLSFHRDLTRRSIEPEIRMPGKPVYVRAAGKDLERVLMNLISNTVRHGRGASRIGFTLEQKDGWAVCTLRDDGCGIAASELPFLFENPYAGERRSPAGSMARGLGLFIVRKLLARMGGAIEAESGQAGGTVFRFTLPLL